MTQPSPPPKDDSERAPHQHRQVAESFGSDAERYDRTRPPYPAAMVEQIVEGSPGPEVLDVGCGTGIEARQFRTVGCTVLGVEPDPRMAEFARRSGIEVEEATFEAWDPAGREFDTIIAGTAWHWVDPIAGAAKAARLLRTGGRLAPFHHVLQPPPELADAFAEVYQLTAPMGAPRELGQQLANSALEAYQPLFTKMADGIRQTSGFSEPEQWRFDWDRAYTRDEWLDHLPTLGGASQLPSDKLATVLDTIGAAIDAVGGRFTMHYVTVVVTTTRTPPA